MKWEETPKLENRKKIEKERYSEEEWKILHEKKETNKIRKEKREKWKK